MLDEGKRYLMRMLLQDNTHANKPKLSGLTGGPPAGGIVAAHAARISAAAVPQLAWTAG